MAQWGKGSSPANNSNNINYNISFSNVPYSTIATIYTPDGTGGLGMWVCRVDTDYDKNHFRAGVIYNGTWYTYESYFFWCTIGK